MSVVNAERFIELKAKVKAEMLRRNKSGSVAAYGGTAYDYTVPPAAGKTIRQEHRDKLVEPMRAINSELVLASVGTVIKEDELANLETRAAVLAVRSMTDQSGSDCKSGCTGTCYTGCATGCSGCGSGCPTGCSGSCLTSCSGSCLTSCSDCEGGCFGCGSGCPDGCSGCGSGCPGGCSGCGSGCSGSCLGSCDTGCYETCYSHCSAGCPDGCTGTCSDMSWNGPNGYG